MNKSKAILKSRAKSNALIIDKQIDKAKLRFLVFRVVKEIYAIEQKWVKEVVKVRCFTEIPGTPDFVIGVANIRGAIYSAININRFLSSKEYGLSELDKVIIVSNGVTEYGIVADEIIGFSDTLAESISEMPDNFNDIYREFIEGICKNGALILNGRALTDNKKIIID